MLKQKPWELLVDDITVVTLLQADPAITVEYVEPDDDPNKPAKNAHCTWHLLVRRYTEEEIQTLIDYFYAFGGKCGPDERQFTYRCPECGLGWVLDGPCGEDCSRAMLGRLPDYHLFDAVKRNVIKQKRTAQEELAQERKEGPLYHA